MNLTSFARTSSLVLMAGLLAVLLINAASLRDGYVERVLGARLWPSVISIDQARVFLLAASVILLVGCTCMLTLKGTLLTVCILLAGALVLTAMHALAGSIPMLELLALAFFCWAYSLK